MLVDVGSSITCAKGTEFVAPFARGVWSASLMLGVWKSHLAKQNLKGTCSTCIRLDEVKRRLGILLDTDINKHDLDIPNPWQNFFLTIKLPNLHRCFELEGVRHCQEGTQLEDPAKLTTVHESTTSLKLESDMNKFGWFRLLIALKTKTTQRIWRLKDLKDPQSVKTPWRSRVESGTFEHPQKSTRIATSQGSLLSRMDRPAVEGHTLYIAGFVSFVWWHGDFEWYPQKILKESI